MNTSATDLKERAPSAALRLARRQLAEALNVSGRLSNPKDSEALHDFRVAIRRLRVVASEYRDFLGKAGSEDTRLRLKGLTVATNAVRDAQVLSRLLKEIGRENPSGAAQRLLRRLSDQFSNRRNHLGKTLVPDFVYLAGKISDQIERAAARADHKGRKSNSIKTVFKKRLRKDAKRLSRRIDRVRSLGDAKEIHEARIAAKRVRYLVEPFASRIRKGVKTVRNLKEIQDTLGRLHDLQVLEDLLKSKNKAIRKRQKQLFYEFRRDWIKRKHRKLFSRLAKPF